MFQTIYKSVFILTTVLMTFLTAPAQLVENGWKGILPLKSNKAYVDKVLGTPRADQNDYFNYFTDEAMIQVNYSTAPCRENQYDRGRYDIPANTVLDVWVHPRKPVKLPELKIDLTKYYRDTSGDVLNVVYYFPFRDGKRGVVDSGGLSIGVAVRETTEYVTSLTFRPPAREAEKLKCASIKPK